jgi:hypothetical protein
METRPFGGGGGGGGHLRANWAHRRGVGGKGRFVLRRLEAVGEGHCGQLQILQPSQYGMSSERGLVCGVGAAVSQQQKGQLEQLEPCRT